MNRRSFLSSLIGAGVAATLDPEKLLWEPGKKLISIPKPLPFQRTVILWHGEMKVRYISEWIPETDSWNHRMDMLLAIPPLMELKPLDPSQSNRTPLHTDSLLDEATALSTSL